MAGLERFNFNIIDEPRAVGRPTVRGQRSETPEGAGHDPGFTSDEAAARYHLSRVLETDRRPAVRGVTAPERAERVPSLHLVDLKEQPGMPTKLVRFEQTQDDIPIFGAHAVCELTEERAFVSANGRVGRVDDVSSFPAVSQDEARTSIADATQAGPQTLKNIAPAKLNFFEDKDGKWHLVWLFENVPAAPPGFLEHSEGHGLGGSPRTRKPLVDYLVDAHTAEIVFYFSANPLFCPPPLPVPVYGTGESEDGDIETLWGRMSGSQFELNDPSRDIRTHDLCGGDIDTAVLGDPYRAPGSSLGASCRAIVSAHANATTVYDFLTSVLQRDGIDDAGMELINVVNCTSSADEPPPSWGNAVWWQNRMWYGQEPNDAGAMVSFARFLDVIAHELTHGVTQSEADLVYQDQPGALNESVSDIFGILVKNWHANPPDGGDVAAWDWELGAGLGPNTLPLRDMSDPTRTGDPDHMSNYNTDPGDHGGVHTNSNIHNKAAYNVFTATDVSGQRMFTPREVALLFYYALIRLGRMDEFREMRVAVLDVASSMYAGDIPLRDAKMAAIRDAYDGVGIS